MLNITCYFSECFAEETDLETSISGSKVQEGQFGGSVADARYVDMGWEDMDASSSFNFDTASERGFLHHQICSVADAVRGGEENICDNFDYNGKNESSSVASKPWNYLCKYQPKVILSPLLPLSPEKLDLCFQSLTTKEETKNGFHIKGRNKNFKYTIKILCNYIPNLPLLVLGIFLSSQGLP